MTIKGVNKLKEFKLIVKFFNIYKKRKENILKISFPFSNFLNLDTFFFCIF